MTCDQVQRWMEEHRPFAQAKGNRIPVSTSQHVESCSTCQRQWQWELAVHHAMHNVAVPDQLEQELQHSLCRVRRERQRARVLYASMAAAAVLLLTLALNWYLQQPYDLAKLSSIVSSLENQRPIASLVVTQPVRIHDLKQWLERQGVNASIPQRIKLQYVTSLQLVEMAGRKVAVLDLQAGGITSKVCLLERRFFNEKSMRQLHDSDNLTSFIISDNDESATLGWMIVEPSSAHLFVEGPLNPNGA